MELKELAKKYYNCFEWIDEKKAKRRKLRENIYLVKSKCRSEELTEFCREAHGDMLPDDYRYSFIVNALELLSEYDDTDEARDAIEADVYTSDLTAWLNSNNSRVYYLDEAKSNFGNDMDAFALLSTAQLCERREVFESVLSSLENLAE